MNKIDGTENRNFSVNNIKKYITKQLIINISNLDINVYNLEGKNNKTHSLSPLEDTVFKLPALKTKQDKQIYVNIMCNVDKAIQDIKFLIQFYVELGGTSVNFHSTKDTLISIQAGYKNGEVEHYSNLHHQLYPIVKMLVKIGNLKNADFDFKNRFYLTK